MKELFRSKEFSNSFRITLDADSVWSGNTHNVIGQLITIIEEYEDKNIKLSLRQLYYQMVARGFIPNHDKVYKKLGDIVRDLRYNGSVDWNAIEDRSRSQYMHSQWKNIAEIVSGAIHSYRKDRWEGQDHYIELITEKEALESVLYPITQKYHIRLCINKGYYSASSMYDLYERIRFRLKWTEKDIHLLYLGDHDPSGLDMIRDIYDRCVEFLTGGESALNESEVRERFKIIPVALTREQIDKFSPPPNPAKITDPRAKWYIAQHGMVSWEVDALRPEDMIEIVEDKVKSYIDIDKMDTVKAEEKHEVKQLEEFLESMERDE